MAENDGFLYELIHDHGRSLLVAGLALALGLYGLSVWLRPVQLQELPLKDASGGTVSLADLHQGRPRLVLVFLVPGDPVTTFALDKLRPLAAGDMAVAGLVEAQAFRQQADLPFPVHGLKDVADPFAVQDFIKKIGFSTIAYAGVYSGTVVVLDNRNRILLKLEKEEIRELDRRLAKLR